MDTDLAKTYSRVETEGQAIPQALTDSILDTIGEFGSRTDEISGRLYSIKDRLFGSSPSPVNAGNSKGANPPANGFADAFNNRASDVRATLILIDQLSTELANRL